MLLASTVLHRPRYTEISTRIICMCHGVIRELGIRCFIPPPPPALGGL